MSGRLISKTVRLPEDLVIYVEEQPGRDFSKKLIGILEEYRQGDLARERMLLAYEKQINDYREKIRDMSGKYWDSSNMLRLISLALRDYPDMMPEDLSPGDLPRGPC